MDNEEVSTTKKSFWQTLPGIITAVAGIITALTGLFVAISNFKSNSSQQSEKTKSVVATEEKPATYRPPPNEINKSDELAPEITMTAAKKVTNDLINAFKHKNVNEIMPLVSAPFFNDEKVSTDLNEVREKFEKIIIPVSEFFSQIQSITVKTIGEWKNEGRLDYQIPTSLNIKDNNFYAVVEFPKDAIGLAFRSVDGRLKIAGIWDQQQNHPSQGK